MAGGQPTSKDFQPYVPAEAVLPELTLRAVLLGAAFGVLFGAATVYLALKAGLTVSASIPIAVIAISLGHKVLGTSILENNVIQTAGSAGESIAAGVVFTLPGFLFLSIDPATRASVGAGYFGYATLFSLSLVGGLLGVLMMIPLRRSLIVKEHGTLQYPEGTACASVLIAGDRGGEFARTAFLGVGIAFAYALLQRVLHVVAEVPAWVTRQTDKWLPSATVNGEITPEYLGVGYIIGPRIAGQLVAGGVLSWLALIPLVSVLAPPAAVAAQLGKLGFDPVSRFGWDPAARSFADVPGAIYFAYVRQIGAGAVAAGGFVTLLKTLPTLWASLRDSVRSLSRRGAGAAPSRTERDLSFATVVAGSIGLVAVLMLLPQVPGRTFLDKLLVALLVIAFGFVFVTVSSRIVGIIGSSSNPISGMTIATLMATAMVFVGIGWTGRAYEPMALVVGGMVCIAAANAGATSQDLKTGFLVGATPRAQQLALFAGALASAVVIGLTVKLLDRPTAALAAQGVQHAIGTKFPAPQATLMATLVRGLLSRDLDWHFVLVGAFLAVTMELCGVKSLSFAVGAYLPLSTTLPIFAGGAVKGLADLVGARRGRAAEEGELGAGSLFATGLVAGGALMGVTVALLQIPEPTDRLLKRLDLAPALARALGEGGYQLVGVGAFALLALLLLRTALRGSRGPGPAQETHQ